MSEEPAIDPNGTTKRFAETAEEHKILIHMMCQLDYVRPALVHNKERIDTLLKQIDLKQAEIDKLEEATKKEYKEFASISRKGTKQFFAKLSGGKQALEKKISREEQEYLNAFRKEREEKTAYGIISQELSEERNRESDLQLKVQELENIRQKINDLYSRAFGGNTPEFPTEDEAEEQLRLAQQEHDVAQSELSRETVVLDLLTKAEKEWWDCFKAAQEAKYTFGRDVYQGGDSAKEFARAPIGRSSAAANKFHLFVDQASATSPNFPIVIPPIQPAGADFFKDIFLDTASTEATYTQKLTEAIARIRTAGTLLDAGLKGCKRRLTQLKPRLKQASILLMGRRIELENIRRSILETVASNGGEINIFEADVLAADPGDALPGYSRGKIYQDEFTQQIMQARETTTFSSSDPNAPPPPHSIDPPPPPPSLSISTTQPVHPTVVSNIQTVDGLTLSIPNEPPPPISPIEPPSVTPGVQLTSPAPPQGPISPVSPVSPGPVRPLVAGRRPNRFLDYDPTTARAQTIAVRSSVAVPGGYDTAYTRRGSWSDVNPLMDEIIGRSEAALNQYQSMREAQSTSPPVASPATRPQSTMVPSSIANSTPQRPQTIVSTSTPSSSSGRNGNRNGNNNTSVRRSSNARQGANIARSNTWSLQNKPAGATFKGQTSTPIVDNIFRDILANAKPITPPVAPVTTTPSSDTTTTSN